MKSKQKKLKLGKVTIASFVTVLKKDEAKKVKGGTWWQGCDIHTINDYSCPIGGTCNTGRCHEATINTYCECDTYCSECYTQRFC
jgi:hypothetical protein